MKICCVSLGCDKNLVDTERMLGALNREGYEFTDDEQAADIIIINTCCFINDAKEESVNTILEMAQLKQEGQVKALIVTGCMAQRYQEEIFKEIPEVDAILGTSALDEILNVIKEALAGKQAKEFRSLDRLPCMKAPRVLTTGGHYAYLKIAEGCDKHCTYCIIPSLRGSYRSIPMEELIEEARSLGAEGVKELILVAQETTLYGVDLYGSKRLPALLKELFKVSVIQWIRLQYSYPEEITQELIDTIAKEEKICHYLDIPIQHASDSVLRRMGRKTTRKKLEELIGNLREQIPDIALRTTLISGFPGETKEDHETLKEFVDQMEFERLGVFAYSQEEDTPAAEFSDQVEEEVKAKRRDEIMELQQEIAFEKSQAMVGRKLDVMIEGEIVEEHAYVGRTYMDAPGVDGLIFINTEKELMSGDFVRVSVTGAVEYDLTGEICDEFTE